MRKALTVMPLSSWRPKRLLTRPWLLYDYEVLVSRFKSPKGGKLSWEPKPRNAPMLTSKTLRRR